MKLIVEVMRDDPGHAAQAFRFLELPVLILQFFPLRLRLLVRDDIVENDEGSLSYRDPTENNRANRSVLAGDPAVEECDFSSNGCRLLNHCLPLVYDLPAIRRILIRL